MKAKILIVDDEPNNHLVYERVLAPLELDVVKAMSGQQALAVAHKQNFFLILMDVQMPGIDGFETAGLILDHPKTSHIPIIFITAFARDESFEFKGYACGAVDYMVKPINDEVLRHKVKVFLSLFTERLKLKHALSTIEASELRFRTLFDKSNDAIFVISRETRAYIDANKAALVLTGRSLQELQLLNCDDIISEDASRHFKEVNSSSPTVDLGTVTFTRKDEKKRLAQLNLVYLDEGTLVGIARDITDEQNMQRQLRRSQRMDAVGQLTGGIAHDFNNILGIILGNVELIQGQISADDKLTSKVESIRKSAKRAADLTSRLLSFSGRQAATVQAVNINQIIEQMDTLIGRSVTPQIQVKHYFSDELWLAAIDSGDFEDALLNLVLNAHDAMKGSGQITIETCNTHLDAGFCKLNPGAVVGDYIQLAINDNGGGIPADVQEHLFEPFFTTKAEGKGTGLGLAMVYGFVSRSSGYIKVYSELGIGTTFRIYLPKVMQAISKDEPEKSEVIQTSKSNELILVVDDEPDLLALAVETLEGLGYQTLKAASGDEAIQCLQEHPNIELIFSDVVMPGKLNGYQLAEQATMNNPNLKVLLTSGFTSRSSINTKQVTFKTNLLHKPYTQLEMSQRIRALLSIQNIDSNDAQGKSK